MYELLRPLYDELVRQIIGYWYVQAVGTTVRVISKGKADKEYLWMLKAVMEKLVIFHDDNGSREYTLEKQRKLWNRQSPHPCRISLKSGWKAHIIKVPPKSRKGQAISYVYPLWSRMKTCLKVSNIKIDNNLSENAILFWRSQERTFSSVKIMKPRKIQRSSVHCLPPARHRKSIQENGWIMPLLGFPIIKEKTPAEISENYFRMSGSWRSPTKIQLKSNIIANSSCQLYIR